jgi:hypothetical protein
MFDPVTLRRLARAALVVVLCLAVPACGKKKVTKANYDKIEVGMTQEQVEKILGKGSKDEGGDGSNVAAQVGVAVGGVASAPTAGPKGETYIWESGTRSITITFVDGKVRLKQSSGL